MATRKATPTATASASEAQINLSTSEVEVAKIALEEYLKVATVNRGLVASFRSEAYQKPEMLTPKTEEGWKMAFIDQSAQVYK